MLRWLAIVFSTACLAQIPQARDETRLLVDLNQADIKDLETRVARNPDDLSARMTLAEYFKVHGPRVDLLDHILYVIAHHPESCLAPVISRKALPGKVATQKDYDRVVEAWKKAAKDHPENPRVQSNAAQFQ